MLNHDYITELLNLEDVIIQDVKRSTNSLDIYLQLPQRPHPCPACGKLTDHVHDYREQVVKDVPFGQTTLLHLRKRRYRCPDCGKRFAEKNFFLPRYRRVTSRLVASVLNAFGKVVSATEIASRYNISVSTALRYFDCISYGCRTLPRVLSIDEFKGNAGGEKYQSILADPENKHILDILPNRFEADLIRYFKTFSCRNKVEYFVSDMNPHFRSVAKVCFPKAIIVADRYHVIRQAIWAMERVRKEEQKNLSKKFRTYFKHSKYLLNKKWENLNEEEMHQLALMLEIAPRLADAYRIKNDFLEIMKCKSSKEGKHRLADWLLSVEVLELPEFKNCTKACHNWFQEILNAMDCPWSNGFTEGCNNKTKVLKRTCYGVKDFNRFRNRILHCAA